MQSWARRADVAGTALRLVTEPDAVRLLSGYAIPYPGHGLARSGDEAVHIAGRLGYPVVLKVVSADVVHKSDVGGVITALANPDAVREAYESIFQSVRRAIPDATIEGVLVCEQAHEGFEVIVGALDETTFGPTVMFGQGGIFAEVQRDVVFRVAPLERRDAQDMIEEIEAYPTLVGARGQAAYDLGAVVELLLSVSRLVMDHREIQELDLNPVRVYEHGLMALDVRLLQRVDSRT
jgi:acyl-CoA synthetase (NDP forming)